MSKQVPVPTGSGRRDRPEVIVLDTPRRSHEGLNPFLRLAMGLAPDILRLIERSTMRKPEIAPRQADILLLDRRKYTSGFQLSEIEVDTRVPFVRKVTVRKSSAWTSDLPAIETLPVTEPRRGRLARVGRVGLVSVGGAIAVATVGLLARGSGNLVGSESRRD